MDLKNRLATAFANVVVVGTVALGFTVALQAVA